MVGFSLHFLFDGGSLWITCILYMVSRHNTDARYFGPKEYCFRDTFEGKCGSNEVIVITSAVYGRIRIGECVKTDSEIGCKEDMIHVLARACSGKRECSYPVMTLERESNAPCGEMKSYLEAEYECHPVLTAPPSAQCDSRHSRSLLASDSQGYISSDVARATGCGDMAHPWRVEVLHGQRVNVTLKSFHQQPEATGHKRCKPLGYITEVGHRNNVTICPNIGGNEHVYTSNGRHIQIYINTRDSSEDDSFMLHYHVFGCADLKVGAFAWYKREGNVATIGCEGQDIRWELKCDGDKWRGVVGNCSDNIAASVQRSTQWSPATNIQAVTLVCICVGFVLLLVIAGTVVIFKWKASNKPQQPTTILLQEEQFRGPKGPLPPIPEHQDMHRTLVHQPTAPAYHQFSQTLPRPPPQYPSEYDEAEYNYNWNFSGTAPWKKQAAQP